MPRHPCPGSRSGSVAIEMALVLPFLILMIYGIIQVGQVLYTVAAMNYAVERASRCAVVNAIDCNGAGSTTQCYAAHAAIGVGLTCGEVTVASANCATGVPGIRVSASHDFRSPLLRLLPGGNTLTIRLQAQSCFPS